MTTTEIIALTTNFIKISSSLFWRASVLTPRREVINSSADMDASLGVVINDDAVDNDVKNHFFPPPLIPTQLAISALMEDPITSVQTIPQKSTSHDITKKIRKEMDDLDTKGLLHALLITVST